MHIFNRIRFIWAKAMALFQWMTCLLPWHHRDEQRTRLQAQNIVAQIERQAWTALRLEFVFFVRLFLSESLLEKGWNIVCKGFGQLKSTGTPIITVGWWLTSVSVPLTFEHVEYALLLQMTQWGKIVGFRFTSQQALGLATGWKKPCYADKPVRESAMTLGKGKFKVEGTLCLPNDIGERAEVSRFPCVVFLAGSGPCDRDSTIGENKPFRDLALGLASQNIASIRFDKVTHTHRKTFRDRKDITLTDEYVEHAMDAVLQAQKHPNILPHGVFVLGHSLGAVVAPMITAMNNLTAGCIIMAGPAEPIYRCFVRQLRYIMSLDGPEALYLNKQIDAAQAQAELADSDKLTLSTPAKKLPFGIGPSYWLDYRNFKPIETCASLKKPILIMQGDRDYQVTIQDDYLQWRAALSEKQNVQLRLYERLNHLFISGSVPSTPIEYTVPGNVDEQVINDTAKWVAGNRPVTSALETDSRH